LKQGGRRRDIEHPSLTRTSLTKEMGQTVPSVDGEKKGHVSQCFDVGLVVVTWIDGWTRMGYEHVRFHVIYIQKRKGEEEDTRKVQYIIQQEYTRKEDEANRAFTR
jgi:hypothetical protein